MKTIIQPEMLVQLSSGAREFLDEQYNILVDKDDVGIVLESPNNTKLWKVYVRNLRKTVWLHETDLIVVQQ